MAEKKKASRYSPEFRERAVRLLDEHRSDYPSLSAACREIGGKLGCSSDSLHDWWKQARRDAGARPGPTSAETPNQLWVSDFTYVQTWNDMVYVAFIIDVFARRIVGWKVSNSMTTQLMLDALEQAIWERKLAGNKALIHHSDRGSQYLSIRYTERLALSDNDASVGTVGDSYDNALAETINGLYKAEVIHHLGPWKSMAQVERETLKWVDWYNNRRLLAPIGYRPPAEAERAFYADQSRPDLAA
ncbi:IS3 family transposase [Asaia sp. BMEF1]